MARERAREAPMPDVPPWWMWVSNGRQSNWSGGEEGSGVFTVIMMTLECITRSEVFLVPEK